MVGGLPMVRSISKKYIFFKTNFIFPCSVLELDKTDKTRYN